MKVHTVSLPDGRYLAYYEFGPQPWDLFTGLHPDVASAPRIGEEGASELRWNPLLSEWLVTAAHRQNRTFLPAVENCPFCPATPAFIGEVPRDNYDVVVLENRFPSLQPNPGAPGVASSDLYPVEPSRGVCEVMLYSPEHTLTLAEASVEQILKIILVWTSRWIELKKLPFVQYVFVFENKGEAVGVTLHHPHGQIYAYPFVPPKIATELESSRQYQRKTGRCLICSIAERERDENRIVTENESFAAYVPFFARWPYEVHIVSRRHCQALDDFTVREQRDLAELMKAVLSAYDGLFGFSFPYMMVLHQKPTGPEDYGYYHFHIEFYPPLRTAARLKYLAGSETGAGMFINDTLPESKAAELRAHIPGVVWQK
jgi:UDPglucose--hexose-1-phosphate uridylyltransferase